MDRKLIEQICGSAKLRQTLDALTQWQKVKNEVESSGTTFRVVVTGQQNNGKSTLCQALTGAGKQVFATKDGICTKEITEYLARDGITYVDTPGYGTTSTSDNQLTRDAWLKASLVLFLHSLAPGELAEDEIRMLKDLLSTLGNCCDRVLVVCTKASECEDHLTEVSRSIQNQLIRINGQLGMVCVDTRDFLDFTASHETELLEGTHIPDVQNWIRKNRTRGSMAEVFLNQSRNAVLTELEAVKDRLNAAIRECREQRVSERYRLVNGWYQFRSVLENCWNECRQYKG